MQNDYKPLPPILTNCKIETTRQNGNYISNNALIYVLFEIFGEKGKNIFFTDAERNAHTYLFWHLDNNYKGSTFQFHSNGF